MAGIQDIDSEPPMDYFSIVSYIQTHSDTDSFEELDDALWHYILSSLSVENLKRFIKDCPNSKYINEARLLLRWKSITCGRNIFEINDFIKENRGFLLIKEAYELLEEVKVEELESMQANILRYSPHRLLSLIDSNVFSIDELCHYGLMKEFSDHEWHENLFKSEMLKYTHHLDCDFFELCKINDDFSYQDAVDVFLVGVDYDDITNLLLGLSSTGSFRLDVDDILGHELKSFCDEGCLFPTLPLNHFLYRIHGKIYDSENNVNHQVNFISVPLIHGNCMESLRKRKIDKNFMDLFEELDKNFIKNDHQKIFFIIINQTKEIVHYSAEIITDNNEVEILPVAIRQIYALHGFISELLVCELIKKVKAIHFIVTNSNTLLIKENQKENMNYRYSCDLDNIKLECGKFPLFMPFSLGKSYLGGIFDYNDTDSENICHAIINSLSIKRTNKVCQKIKSYFARIMKKRHH